MDDTLRNEQATAPEETNQDTCTLQLNQLKEKYAYLQAEIDNYRKRVEKERVQWIQSAQAGVLTDVLEIVDDLERALQELAKTPELAIHLTGFQMIEKAVQKLLKTYHVEEIKSTTVFDTHMHEAIMQVASDSHTSGDVVKTLQKGYTFKGNVLRPAKVSVAQ